MFPGATIEIKNNATGDGRDAGLERDRRVLGARARPGTYTVTVSLHGFKTYVMSDVRLVAATPATVKATLQLGALTETVEVKGGTDLVQTQSTVVSRRCWPSRSPSCR